MKDILKQIRNFTWKEIAILIIGTAIIIATSGCASTNGRPYTTGERVVTGALSGWVLCKVLGGTWQVATTCSVVGGFLGYATRGANDAFAYEQALLVNRVTTQKIGQIRTYPSSVNDQFTNSLVVTAERSVGNELCRRYRLVMVDTNHQSLNVVGYVCTPEKGGAWRLTDPKSFSWKDWTKKAAQAAF